VNVAEVDASRVAPLLDFLRAEGLKPDLEDGIWLTAERDGEIAGVARVLERDGLHMLEDVWVQPELRRQGIASELVRVAAERHDHLWLICDEGDVSFYERREFKAVEPSRFPPAFAQLYATKGEWPGRDHVHVAMLRGEEKGPGAGGKAKP
jgi:GNAT superfamily N-acetyltransferase